MAELKEAIALCYKQLKLPSSLADQAMTQEGESNQEYLYNLLNKWRIAENGGSQSC